MSKVAKSYYAEDPVLNYTNEHSDQFPESYHKLMEVTLKHRASRMMGAPEVVRMNMNLIRAIGGRKALDIGVFTGSSSMGAALALPADGKVVACDVSDEYVNIGRPFWKEGGVDHKIDVRIQPALKTLDELIENGEAATFDFAFIDADKKNYHNYYEKCLVLLRPMGVISVDNVLWDGKVLDTENLSEDTKALKEFNDKVRDDDRVFKTMHNIGDGLTLIFKK